MPIFIEPMQCFIVNLAPGGIAIPEVLVAHEGDIEVLGEATKVIEFRAVLNEKFCRGVFGEMLFPAFLSLANFSISDIHTGEWIPCFPKTSASTADSSARPQARLSNRLCSGTSTPALLMLSSRSCLSLVRSVLVEELEKGTVMVLKF